MVEGSNRVNSMMDGSNNWGVDRMNGVVDSMMGSHWDRVCSHQGSSVVNSVVGNDGGGVNSVVSHRVDRGLVYRLRVCLVMFMFLHLRFLFEK